MERVKALLWTFFAEFLGQCGKNCADSFPAKVKEWFKQIYDLLQKYCKHFGIYTAIWIGLISAPFILKHYWAGWFWDQAPDAVRLFLQQIYDLLPEHSMYLWIGLISVIFLVKCCCVAKLASQNETLSSEDKSANQGENANPSPSQTSTTVAGNEGKPHKIVLKRCLPELLSDLDFKAVEPFIIQKDLFHDTTMRDISEQKTSNDKIMCLIKRLMERDDVTYERFKECLVLSKQKHVKDLLERKENEHFQF